MYIYKPLSHFTGAVCVFLALIASLALLSGELLPYVSEDADYTLFTGTWFIYWIVRVVAISVIFSLPFGLFKRSE